MVAIVESRADARRPGDAVGRLHRPGPPSGALADAGQRAHRAVPRPGHPRASPGWSTTATARSGRCPTTASAPRPTRPTSCCACTTSRPDWETAGGGAGAIEVGEFISLRDPDRRIPFPIVNEATPERLLTGGDFDIESVVRCPRRHVLDRRGVRPVPAPRRRAPARCSRRRSSSPTASRRPNPYLQPGETPRVRSSRGLRGDGRRRATAAACTRSSRARSPTTRSPAAGSSTSSTPAPSRTPAAPGSTRPTPTPTSSATPSSVGNGQLVLIERDDFEGPASVTKRLYEIDLRRTDADGFVAQGARRRPAARSPTPTGIGTAASPGALRRRRSVRRSRCSRSRSVVQLRDGRLLVGNDNNYPGSNGARPRHARRHRDDRHRPRRVAGTGRRRTTTARHRPPGRQRLPARAHARRLRAGHPAVRRLHRARPRADEGRRARRPPRERDRRHHRRRRRTEFADRRTTKVDRRRHHHRLVHRGLHARRAAHAAGRRAASPPCARRTPRSTASTRSPPSTRSSTSPATRAPATARPVGVYPETKHPTYFDSIGLSLEEPLVRRLEAQRLPAAAARRSSSRASRPATCASSTG